MWACPTPLPALGGRDSRVALTSPIIANKFLFGTPLIHPACDAKLFVSFPRVTVQASAACSGTQPWLSSKHVDKHRANQWRDHCICEGAEAYLGVPPHAVFTMNSIPPSLDPEPEWTHVQGPSLYSLEHGQCVSWMHRIWMGLDFDSESSHVLTSA